MWARNSHLPALCKMKNMQKKEIGVRGGIQDMFFHHVIKKKIIYFLYLLPGTTNSVGPVELLSNQVLLCFSLSFPGCVMTNDK